MASRILTLKRCLADPKRVAFTRGLCSVSPAKAFLSHVAYLGNSLSPAVVSVASFFSPSDDGKIYHSCRGGSGVLLDPTLIVTSAHVVGRLSTSYESGTELDHGFVLHKSEIGSTAALTTCGLTLKMKPLAVNFGNDVAVLEVVNANADGTTLAHCMLSNSLPYRENALVAISLEPDSRLDLMMGKVRALRQKTVRAKAPWPLDDELGWIEHDCIIVGSGGRAPASTSFNPREKVTGSIISITGSPWFNLNGEVVGIASWELRDEQAKSSVGFAVPAMCIRSILDYAKTKGPKDPIVMDDWVDAHVIPPE